MKRLVFLSALGLVTAFVLPSCEGDRGPAGPQGPPGPSLTINTVNASPFIVDAGDTSIITVSVTYAGVDILSCTWTAEAGTIIGSGPVVRWEAPEAVGHYVISVVVSDGKSSAEGHVTVHVQPRHLVAYYPFNGNANDGSGNENRGAVNGAAPTADRFGNANSAYSFDGVDDYIQIPHHPALNFGAGDFTIDLWVHDIPSTPGQGTYLIHKGTTGGGATACLKDPRSAKMLQRRTRTGPCT